MRRTAAAALLPAVAITGAWLSLEQPRLIVEGAAVAALALLPALVRARWARAAAVIGTALVAAWIAFSAEPWELLPFRDERVVAPVVHEVAQGVVDFYAVFLPFEPSRRTWRCTASSCARSSASRWASVCWSPHAARSAPQR